MVTKLQRRVEIIEDRHFGDIKKGNKYSKRCDFYRGRGSVISATPKEMKWLHQLSFPMNEYANHCRSGYGNTPKWKKELNAENR